jgi:hypothetical protein
LISKAGITPVQVQVILYEDANKYPTKSLVASTPCTLNSSADACVYERLIGQTARYLKQRYPHTQQMFLHSRTYGGYDKLGINPEPYAYEYGFSTKWLIQAQIHQKRTGVIDSVAGDLSYASAPWLVWGPYFWAFGVTPRFDDLTWVESNFNPSDGVHLSPSGVSKVSSMMMNFYLDSVYTPWFRANP